jgi:hypothetical protein
MEPSNQQRRSGLVGFSIAFAVLVGACATKTSASRDPASPRTEPAPEKTTAAPSPVSQPPDRAEAEARFRDLRARAEAGEVVDFGALRLAWLHGPGAGPEDGLRRDGLRKEMFEAMKVGGDPKIVLAKARELIDISYVDLEAQKARRQACAILHEEPCAEHGHRIEMGMLKSIMQSGDGKSCATGWKVVTIHEEYFVMRMVDARLKRQSLLSEGGHHCDAMLVDRDGHEQTMYFEVTEVLSAMARRFK